MYDYASLGGRVLASHWQHIWFSAGPGVVAGTGTWTDREDPSASGAPLPATINQSFAKGAAFAKWLVGVGASQTAGTLSISFPRDNLQAANPAVAREWLTVQNPRYPADPKVVEYMSFTAPVGAPVGEACGRAAYTGLHVSLTAPPGEPPLPGFPLNCEDRPISAQEQAIIFMLFELSSCISATDVP
mgnify:CR=1 FL=1